MPTTRLAYIGVVAILTWLGGRCGVKAAWQNDARVSATPQVQTLIDSLSIREGQFLRIGLQYRITSGVLENLKTKRADGDAHVWGCLSGDLKSTFPAVEVTLKRDFASSATHMVYGRRDQPAPIYKEYLYDGTTLTHFIGVDGNSRVQSTIEQTFPKDLSECSVGHPRPDLLAVTQVKSQLLSTALQAAARQELDTTGQATFTLEDEGEYTKCVFRHMEPTIVAGHGQGHRVSWHRIYFRSQEGDVLPVRIDELTVHGPTPIPRVAYFLEDWEPAEGVLFPRTIRAFQFAGDQVLASRLQIESVELNEDVQVPSTLPIPPGTTVTDLIANKRFRQAMHPKEVDRRVAETMREIATSGAAPTPSRSARQWIVWLNFVLVAGIAAVIVLKLRHR